MLFTVGRLRVVIGAGLLLRMDNKDSGDVSLRINRGFWNIIR